MARMQWAAAGLLLLGLLLGAASPAAGADKPAAPKGTSVLWGEEGELWDPQGPLFFDFSYAGYRQGNAPLPSPPVTRSVLDFRTAADGSQLNDTAMLVAAVAWANAQPPPADDSYVVLLIPAGEYTLEESLNVTRSRTVLRGEGRDNTTLYVPKSLFQIHGQSREETPPHGYVNNGGFISLVGPSGKGDNITQVLPGARRGDTVIEVEDASDLVVGEYIDLWFQDEGNLFNDAQFDNLWAAPDTYAGEMRARYTTKILAISGNAVTLERRMPYDVDDGAVLVWVFRDDKLLTECGVEGLTFRFEWEPYAGHHLEKGWNGVEIVNARDSWVKDIGTINADNSVTIAGSSAITVTGLVVEASKTRANYAPNVVNEPADYDGHWGIQHEHSFDVLGENFDIRCKLVHDIGTGSAGKFSVYQKGVMVDGNLDLHRALSGPTLYTDIDVGVGTDALLSGGPPNSGPNAVAGTTWWNIMSDQPLAPNKSNGTAGACSFGPVINLIGVDIWPEDEKQMCPTWHYERDVVQPANLFEAQLAVRRAREAAAAAAAPPVPAEEAPEEAPEEAVAAPPAVAAPLITSGAAAAVWSWAALALALAAPLLLA